MGLLIIFPPFYSDDLKESPFESKERKLVCYSKESKIPHLEEESNPSIPEHTKTLEVEASRRSSIESEGDEKCGSITITRESLSSSGIYFPLTS